MSFKFQGDIEDITQIQFDLFKKALQENGFDGGIVQIEPVGKKGDNFVANVKRVMINDNDGRSFKMVVKIASSQENLRAAMNTAILFRNEIILYSEVLPKFTDLQKSARIPEKERLKFAKCYGFISEEPLETILLEDLKESGFSMMDKMKPLTNDEVKLVLKELGTIHSLSYILKQSEPEVYENFKYNLVDLWSFMDTPDIQVVFGGVEQFAFELLEDDAHRAKVKGTITNIGKNASKFQKFDLDSKSSVLLQGDCWTNNIMFRFEGDTPSSCIMIDYQISRNASPAIDLLYFIFNCTDYETRTLHYFDWLDYYYECLSDSLADHGLKSNYEYPREKLDADLKIHGKFAFGLAALLTSMLLREQSEILDIRDQSEEEVANNLQDPNPEMLPTVSKATRDRVQTRLRGLYKSFDLYGYL